MIDVYFEGGPWSGEVREFADPPEIFDMDEGAYYVDIDVDGDVGVAYWSPHNSIAEFARQIERTAYENGFHDGMAA